MLKEMGSVLMPHPEVAFIPALGFFALRWIARSGICLVAAVAWAGYGVLETLNLLRVTCSGECNIRIDLLLIYPFLVGVSGVALAAAALGIVKRLRRGPILPD